MPERDPTRKEIPINPPERSSKDLWYSLNFHCSVAAGWSSGLPEQNFVDETTGKHASELERLKKQAREGKAP